MEPLLTLALSHRWLALVAVLVGLLIRVFKDDTRVPGVIPKPARPWIAFLLGLTLGIIERRTNGAPWRDSIFSGVFVGVLPILGHWFGIEKLRDGKEIGLPGLMVEKKDDKKEPPSPPPPAVMTFFIMAFFISSSAIFLISSFLACTGASGRVNTPRDVARSGVLLIVRAADEGDQVCADIAGKAKGSGDVAKLEKGLALAKTCASAKLRVLEAADVASSSLAVWDAAAERNLGCAALRGLTALGDLKTALVNAGAVLPAIVEDALVMASRLSKSAEACAATPLPSTSTSAAK